MSHLFSDENGEGRLSETKHLLPMPIKTGDKIYYNRFAGNEVKIGDNDVAILMCLDDILAVEVE